MDMKEMVQVKICGITSAAAAKAAAENGAAYLGFVHFPASPRHVTPERAAQLAEGVPAGIGKVSVLVNPENAALKTVLQSFRPDYLQLHGGETPARIREIKEMFGIPVIKAVKIRAADDIAAGMAYRDIADMLLFDAREPENGLPGGNGLKFDWNLLKDRNFSFKWILSGGLNAENVKQAIATTGAPVVDVSSGVESAPGVKDATLIKAFLKQVLKA